VPFWFAATTLAATVMSFHRTLPLPSPSVVKISPPGPVKTATSGDFSPGAIPGPRGRLAAMDAMGV
jgi:hypothetical protein